MSKHAAEKLKYKQTPKPMGVFQVRNAINGKVLLVRSQNVPGKINSIKFQLEMGTHMNKELQNDWHEYGDNNFSFDVLELLKPSKDPLYDNSEDLKTLEDIWLEQLQPYGKKGYNKIKRCK
jgi:hypothetical protein